MRLRVPDVDEPLIPPKRLHHRPLNRVYPAVGLSVTAPSGKIRAVTGHLLNMERFT